MERILSADISKHVGKLVLLQGWVQTIRRHGKVVFFDLRDRTGLTQLVLTGAVMAQADSITEESVISVEGAVVKRPSSLINPNIASGSVEVQVNKLTVYSTAQPLPFPLNDRSVNENSRLEYRYLDLRSAKQIENLQNRAKIIAYIRNWLTREGLTEVETPYISKSTPEGARDYLVPSRIEKGKFYALPQSPQQYKQLLMVAGLEKYFQIVRCFRDEDARADRQPEFTQLDVELSFTTQEEILQLMESLFLGMAKELFPNMVLTFQPFKRLTYREAMQQYGSDRPDLRQDKNDPNELAFVIVENFPMFDWKEGDKRWGATHHPFTAPTDDDEADFEAHPKEALAKQYDLVLNGSEIAGGSIRIHQPEVLERVFAFLGHTKKDIEAKFGHLIKAFSYGVPPHGGFASGLDRLCAIFCQEQSIREVIAFPKTGDGHDLMMHSPSDVDPDQLKELGLVIEDKKSR